MKRSCVSFLCASVTVNRSVGFFMTEQEAWSIALFIDSTCVLFGCQTEHYLSMYRSTFTDSHTLLIAKLFLYIPSLRIVLFTTQLYACINFYASLCKVVQYTLHIFIEWNFYEFYRNNIFLSLYIDIELLNASSPFVWQIKFVSFFFHCVWIRVLNTESG